MAHIDTVRINFSNGVFAIVDGDGDVQFTTANGTFWNDAMIEEVRATAVAVVEYNVAQDEATS